MKAWPPPPMRWTALPLLAEALVVLALVSGAIRFLAFRRVVGLAGWRGRAAGRRGVEGHQAVAMCRRAVNGWARRVPWRTACFQKGLALHLMLRRRGIASVLHYGVDHRQKGLAAHVWLVVDGEIILGGEVAPDFTCLAVFPEPAPSQLAAS